MDGSTWSGDPLPGGSGSAGSPPPRCPGSSPTPASLPLTAKQPDAAGAVWKLGMRQRDLDSNVIRLQPDATIDSHVGPDLDVIILVLSGDGQVGTELGPVDLHAGALAWLPRRSRRQISAGPQGLTYLTVHQRRQALALDPASTRP